MKKFTFIMTVAVLALLSAACQEKQEENKVTQVIAHRGYWKCDGSAQNSIASIRKAGEIGVYGSEFAVSLTSDDVLVVNHDDTFYGYEIAETPFEVIKDSLLANGETLPTLASYLEAAQDYPDMKLIFELKSSKGDTLYEARALPLVVDMLKEYGVAERTEFISFSITACTEFAKMMPDNIVEYLGSDFTPTQLHEMGITGIDFIHTLFAEHPEYVEEAHNLGMVVNVWTVNKEEDIQRMLELGVDYITTNKPLLVAEMIEKFNNPVEEVAEEATEAVEEAPATETAEAAPATEEATK